MPVSSPDELHTGDHILYQDPVCFVGYTSALVASEPGGGWLRVITDDFMYGAREETLQFSSLPHLHKVQYTSCQYSGKQAVLRARDRSGESRCSGSHYLVSLAKTGVKHSLSTIIEELKGVCYSVVVMYSHVCCVQSCMHLHVLLKYIACNIQCLYISLFQPSVASRSKLCGSAHQISCTLETTSSTRMLTVNVVIAMHLSPVKLRMVDLESSRKASRGASEKRLSSSPPSLTSTRSSTPAVSTQGSRLYSELGVRDFVTTVAMSLSPWPRQE